MRRSTLLLSLAGLTLATFTLTGCDELGTAIESYGDGWSFADPDASDVDPDAPDADVGVSDTSSSTDTGASTDTGTPDSATETDTSTPDTSTPDTVEDSTSSSGLTEEQARLLEELAATADASCERDLECIDDYWESRADCDAFWESYIAYLEADLPNYNDPTRCLETMLDYNDCSMGMSSCGAYRAAEMSGAGCEIYDERESQYCRVSP